MDISVSMTEFEFILEILLKMKLQYQLGSLVNSTKLLFYFQGKTCTKSAQLFQKSEGRENLPMFL